MEESVLPTVHACYAMPYSLQISVMEALQFMLKVVSTYSGALQPYPVLYIGPVHYRAQWLRAALASTCAIFGDLPPFMGGWLRHVSTAL